MLSATEALAFEPLVDVTRLLLPGERPQDLTTMHPPDLLRRWFTLQIDASEPWKYDTTMTTTGENMADCHDLDRLVARLMPDLGAELASATEEALSREDLVESIISRGARCGSGLGALTAADLDEGREKEDFVNAFVAGLFLTRPNLEPLERSAMQRHVELLRQLANAGRLAVEQGMHAGMPCFDRYAALMSRRGSLRLRAAVRELAGARQLLADVEGAVRRHAWQALARRAQEQMLVPGTLGEDVGEDGVRRAFQECVSPELYLARFQTEPVTALGTRVRRLLRDRASSLAELFCFYGLKVLGGIRMTLGGIARMYDECFLNCPRLCLPLRDAEAIFYQVFQQSGRADTGEAGLDELGFLRWLLRAGLRRDTAEAEEDDKECIAWARTSAEKCLESFFDDYLTAHGCQTPQDELHRTLSDADVRGILESHEHLLRGVFEAYAGAPGGAADLSLGTPRGRSPRRPLGRGSPGRCSAPDVLQPPPPAARRATSPAPPPTWAAATERPPDEMREEQWLRLLGDGQVLRSPLDAQAGKSIFRSISRRVQHPGEACAAGSCPCSSRTECPRQEHQEPADPGSQVASDDRAQGHLAPDSTRAERGL
ncbi:unnamed protein product [Prorocentrum cordatum]|uniref:Uncharacterized protein n=1 Tax=Prorocentrum cordatum TaxID=2364126 RepID=A0ABN9WS93_9DINO|nr:unnamed protein product [Polarella glacialis]